jgi:hypothetical protein
MSSAISPNDPNGPNGPNAPEPASVPPHGRDAALARSLRYEIAGEEGRALLTSYAVSFTLGLAWLAFVYFGPRTMPMQLLSRDERPIAVTFDAVDPSEGQPSGEDAAVVRVPTPGPTNADAGPRGQRGNARDRNPGGRQATASTGAIADAFGSASGKGTGGLVGDVSNVLRNVDVSSGSGGTGAGANSNGGAGAGGKVVLGAGEGGEGSRTPGRGGIGSGLGTGGAAGGGIGGIGPGGGAVSRTPVRIAPPRPIDAPTVGGLQRDVAEMGTFVRSRESQLRFCYNEYGLKVNPALAGSLTASVSLTPAGGVTGVNVTNRTWSGAGAAETERCIMEKVRGWRFPASEAGGGTYSFSFSFTR